jgi:hypothetical protein
MKKIIVAQLGTRHRYAVPKILNDAGMLACFYSDGYLGARPWLLNLLRAVPPPIRTEHLDRLLGRQDCALPRDKVVSFDLFGLRYRFARALARDTGELHRVFARFGRRFCRRIVNGPLPPADVIWAFDI